MIIKFVDKSGSLRVVTVSDDADFKVSLNRKMQIRFVCYHSFMTLIADKFNLCRLPFVTSY